MKSKINWNAHSIFRDKGLTVQDLKLFAQLGLAEKKCDVSK